MCQTTLYRYKITYGYNKTLYLFKSRTKKTIFKIPIMIFLHRIAFSKKKKKKNSSSQLGLVWRQHPTRHQLYGHLPSITKIIRVRRTRYAGHWWGSRDELISDVLLWTPTYGRAKAGRPTRTYIQQLCEDTGCKEVAREGQVYPC